MKNNKKRRKGIKKFLKDEWYETRSVSKHVERWTKSGEMGKFDIV